MGNADFAQTIISRIDEPIEVENRERAPRYAPENKPTTVIWTRFAACAYKPDKYLFRHRTDVDVSYEIFKSMQLMSDQCACLFRIIENSLLIIRIHKFLLIIL